MSRPGRGFRCGARFCGRSGAGGQVNQVSGTMLRKIDADLTGPAVALSASDAARQARSGAGGEQRTG